MENNDPTEQLRLRFGEAIFSKKATTDDTLTLLVTLDSIVEVLKYIKHSISKSFPILYMISLLLMSGAEIKITGSVIGILPLSIICSL